MINIPRQMHEMLLKVAEALGDDLLDQVTFVGGTTTMLLITDPITRQAVRATVDVDCIVRNSGKAGWYRFREQLRERGFRESMEDDVTCRMRLGELKVDLMPDDALILGFTNRWYRETIETAQPYALSDTITINLLVPVYFVATKLEAYLGRGGNDPLRSHDLEDIINLVDGREELVGEITAASDDVRDYIARQFRELHEHPDFDNSILGNLQDERRADLVFSRWEQIASLARHNNRH